MTTLRPYRKVRQQVGTAMIIALSWSQIQQSAHATDYFLDGRGSAIIPDGLNNFASYVKFSPPTASDNIVVGNQVTGALTLDGIVNGNGLGFMGINSIRVANNAGGAVTIQPLSTGPVLQTLNLGAGGFDLSVAGANLTINKTNTQTLALGLAADQTWIAGNGRTLTVLADAVGTANLTLATLGSGALTTGLVNLGVDTLTINKQGTGTITVGGALTAGNLNATLGTAGNLTFSSTVTVPTITVNNQNSGTVTFSGAVSSTTSVGVTSLSGAVTFGSTLNTPTLNLTTEGGGGATFSGAVSLTNLNYTNQSSGTVTFSSSLAVTNALALTMVKAATLNFNGSVTTPSLSLTALGNGGGIVLGSGGSLILGGGSGGLTVNQVGTNTLTANAVVNAGAISLTTQAGSVINLTKAVSGTTINVTDNSTGNVSFGTAVTDALNASTSFSLTSYKSGTATFLGNIGTVSATPVNFTTYGSMALNVGSSTLATTLNSSALALTTYGTNTSTFNGIVGGTTPGTITLAMNQGSVVNFTKAVSATTINVTDNSTGALTFGAAATDVLTATSLSLTNYRSGGVTFNGAVNIPTITLNQNGSGTVNFAGTGGVVASTSLTGTAIGNSAYSFGGALTSSLVNLTTTNGNATFTGAVNAATSFTFNGLGNNTTTASSTITSPVIAITSAGTLTLNGLVTGTTAAGIVNNFTGATTIGNIAGAGIAGGSNALAVTLTNNYTGSITVGGATGGAITGSSTSLTINNKGISGAGGTVSLNSSNTYAGATTINGGTVNLGYATTNTSKLSDTAALTLNGAIIALTGGSHQEVVANTVIGAGFSQVTRPSGTSVLIAGPITRAGQGGVLDIFVGGDVTTTRANTNSILGGWATTVGGTDWAVGSAVVTTGITALPLGSYSNQTTISSTWNNANVLVAANPTSGSLASQVIGSLKVNASVAVSLPQTSGVATVLDSGGFIGVGTGAKTIGSTGLATAATLTAGTTTNFANYNAGGSNSELFFHVTGGDVTVNSTIINNAALTTTTIGLVKTEPGKLILTANNTYTGQTTVEGGTLQIGAAGTTGSLGVGGAVVLTGVGSVLAFNRSDAALSVSNNISGVGGLTENGTAVTPVLTLTGTNTYSGDTNLTLGGITGGGASLSPNSSFIFANVASAVLTLNAASQVGSLSGGGTTGGNVVLGANTLTLGGPNITKSYSGIISGTGGSIVKTGAGTQTLAGNNTFTGTITIGALADPNIGGLTLSGTNAATGATVNAGTLTISAPSATFGGNVAVNGGTFVMSGTGTSQISGNLSLSHVAIANLGTGTSPTTNITGTTTVNDQGALTVSGIANFTGAVTVNNQGVLSLPTGSVAVSFAGGLTVGQTGAVSTLAGNNTFGTVANGSVGATFHNGGSLTAGGLNIFNGPLVMDGGFTLTTGGSVNTTAYKAPVTISNGTLTVGGSASGSTTAVTTGAVTLSSTITLTAANANLAQGMPISGTGIPAGTTITGISGVTLTLSNPVTVATGVTVTATGIATTAVGSTSVTVNSSAGFAVGQNFVATGIPPQTTISSISGTTLVLSKAATATFVNQPFSVTNSTNTFDQLVTVSGQGAFSPNGTNTFTSGIAVNDTGVLNSVSGNNTIGGSGLTLKNSGGVTLSGVNTINGPLLIDGNGTTALAVSLGSSFNSTTLNGTVTLNTGSLTVGGTAGAFSLGSAATTLGSNKVLVASTVLLVPGMLVSGTGIPAGSTIVSVDNTTNTFIMSQLATAANTGQTFTATSIITAVSGTTISVSTTAGLLPGMIFTATGVPLGTTISQITNSTDLVLTASAATTASPFASTASPCLRSASSAPTDWLSAAIVKFPATPLSPWHSRSASSHWPLLTVAVSWSEMSA